MRTPFRRFHQAVPQHLYMRGVRRQMLFFDNLDRIVYLMNYTVTARKMGIPVLALSIMFDHIHSINLFESRELMASFVRNHLSSFALAYNQDAGRKGPLFEKAYGNAPKQTLKKARSAIIYVGNNHVEKALEERAEQCRWSLIPYLDSCHPFSRKIELRKASARLRRNLKSIDSFVTQNTVIPYEVLRKYYQGLSSDEAEQLTDYLISSYFPIDKEKVLSYFGGQYETFILALHSASGNDFDIKEDYSLSTHKPFLQLCRLCKKSSFRNNIKTIQTVSADKKRQLAETLYKLSDASKKEIGRFLDFDEWRTSA